MYNIPAGAVKGCVHSRVRKPSQTFAHWLRFFVKLTEFSWLLFQRRPSTPGQVPPFFLGGVKVAYVLLGVW